LAKRDLMDALHRFDATVARFDAYEAKLAHDPDDDELPLPPGIASDTEDAEGDLPPDIERRTPPGGGTDPIYDPRDLAHPQKAQQQPAAIEDEEEELPLPPGSPAPDDGELEIPKTALTASLRDPVAVEDD
jgi:hypothetical protein